MGFFKRDNDCGCLWIIIIIVLILCCCNGNDKCDRCDKCC